MIGNSTRNVWDELATLPSFQFDLNTTTSNINDQHQNQGYQYCQPEFSFFQHFIISYKKSSPSNSPQNCNQTIHSDNQVHGKSRVKKRKSSNNFPIHTLLEVEANQGSSKQVYKPSSSLKHKIILQKPHQIETSAQNSSYSKAASSRPYDVHFPPVTILERANKKTIKTYRHPIHQPLSQPKYKFSHLYNPPLQQLNEHALETNATLPPQSLNEHSQHYTPNPQSLNEHAQRNTPPLQLYNEHVDHAQRYAPLPQVYNECNQRYTQPRQQYEHAPRYPPQHQLYNEHIQGYPLPHQSYDTHIQGYPPFHNEYIQSHSWPLHLSNRYPQVNTFNVQPYGLPSHPTN